jgi:hypothetical protein
MMAGLAAVRHTSYIRERVCRPDLLAEESLLQRLAAIGRQRAADAERHGVAEGREERPRRYPGDLGGPLDRAATPGVRVGQVSGWCRLGM